MKRFESGRVSGVLLLLLFGSGGITIDSTAQEQTTGIGQTPVGNTQGGGSSLADFSSLIELIETTVNPDTWENTGGESTISEYPQGVYVDANDTLQSHPENLSSHEGSEITAMLARRSERPTARRTTQDWKSPSNKRYVSLGRLRDAMVASEAAGRNPGLAMSHLAGLSQIDKVYLMKGDIVLSGSVSGLVKTQGWIRDKKTGMAAIRADLLAETFASLQRGHAFGCTIDPSTKGLQNAAKVAEQVQTKTLPMDQAADVLAHAIGRQKVRVFGTQSNTPLALVMVIADRHMKELALGVHPLPESSENYGDIVESHIDRGLPHNLLLRLWFTANARSIRCNHEQTVFELSGTPIKLSGQNERAVADGSRGHAAVDFRTEYFVKGFNENWSEIRTQYPIYAGLESVFQAASAAATSHRFSTTDKQRRLLDWWAALGERLNNGTPLWQTPTQVKTIAVLHSIRQGRKQHHLLVASGGVLLRAPDTVSQKLTTYRVPDPAKPPAETKPLRGQNWWWDQ